MIALEALNLAVKRVSELLSYRPFSLLTPLLTFYRYTRQFRISGWLKDLILPSAYKSDIKALDAAPAR